MMPSSSSPLLGRSIARELLEVTLGLFLLDSGLSHLFLLLGWDQRTSLSLELLLKAAAVYAGLGLLALPLALGLARRLSAASSWSLLSVSTVLLVGPRLLGLLGHGTLGWLCWPVLLAILLGSGVVLERFPSPGGPPNRLSLGARGGLLSFLLLGTKVNVHLLGGSPFLPQNRLWNAGLLLACLGVACLGAVPGLARWSPSVPWLRRPGARRSSWRLAWLLWLGSLLLAWTIPSRVSELPPQAPQPKAPTPSPNVLLVVVDTLRADALPTPLPSEHPILAGDTRPGAHVPILAPTRRALEPLFSRAVVFSAHSSSSPWTLPGFGTLLSGRSPSGHGAQVLVRHGGQEGKKVVQGVQPLRKEVFTLAERLQQAGYRTGLIASNPTLDRSLGLADGIEHHELWLRSGLPYIVPAYGLEPLGFRPLDPEETSYDAAFMRARFEAFIRQDDPRPWLLIAHWMDPHTPYQPPQRYLEGLPPAASTLEARAQRYAGEVAYVAEQLRLLLDGVLTPTGAGKGKPAGARETVILLTSDHGEAFGEHGTWADPGPVPQTFDPYYARQTLHGQSLYEELLHIPLVLWAPGLTPHTVPVPTRAVDVLPTVLELTGLLSSSPSDGAQAGLEGRSLLALAAGQTRIEAPGLGQSLLLGTEKQSWREGRWKLILKPEWPLEVQVELYDLETDPGETRSLHQEAPALAHQLRSRLEAALEALEADHPSPRSGVPVQNEARPSASDLEKLRALGYVP